MRIRKKIDKHFYAKEKSFNEKSFITKVFIIFFLLLFSFPAFGCLYTIEKSSLETNDFDSILLKLKNNENSLVYPDKALLKIVEAVILERKSEYSRAYDIYSSLSESEYQIYAKNRMDILQRYYINPPKPEPKPKKETEETKIARYERILLEVLNQQACRDFFNNFYLMVIEKKYSSEDEFDSYLKSITQNIEKIKADKILIQKIDELILLSADLLKENYAFMTKSKIYFYLFFLYIFKDIDLNKQNAQQALYQSFYNGGLYYYQLLSYLIINTFASNSLYKKFLDIEFTKIDLNYFFNFPEDAAYEFNSLKKDKSLIRKNLKKTFSSSSLKKTDYPKDIIEKHLFLANYFLENNLYLEFSRAIFYLRDLTQNYKTYNPLLVDFYNLTDQYDRAIYYQWDTILTDFFPLSIKAEKKLSSSDLICIFPLWYIDMVKTNIENFKDKFDPPLPPNSPLSDQLFYLAIINAESSFSKDIVSSANAIGLMQLLPSTAAWLRKIGTFEASQNLVDPYYNIETGFYYILYLNKIFNGNIISILGAYNGGHNAFARRKANSVHPLFVSELYPVSETAIYIKKIIRNYLFYKLIYEKKPIEDTIKILIENSLK